MKLRLKANNPLVIKAARERSRILKELGRPVDAKTGRIAQRTPVESRRTQPTRDVPPTTDEGVVTIAAEERLRTGHAEVTELRLPVKVEPGKFVRIYAKHDMPEVKIDGTEYLVLAANDVLQVVQAEDSPATAVERKH